MLTKKTRDTLYEYIYLTSLESNAARHPLFIRLHYIHQNSFTYLTYPTAHMQRHPHSLGTMHVAGTMLTHAILNTENVAAIDRLVLDVADAVDRMKVPLLSDSKQLLDTDAVLSEVQQQTFSKLRSRESVYRTVPAIEDDRRLTPEILLQQELVLLLLFQATRLAALVHDVGHPPFSHIVEYGLQSALPKTYSNHEKVGVELARIIFDDIQNPNSIYASEMTRDFPVFCQAACGLALSLLQAESGDPLYALKTSVLAGDFDADRLDYVRRDIQSTGITTTTYDLGRILDGLHIREVDDQTTPNLVRGAIGVSPRVLSAVETFFTARFHLYRWAIFHHDVTRRNLCMQRFVQLFLTATDLPEALIGLQQRFVELACGEKRIDYKYFTDGFFVDLLWQVWDSCSTRPRLNENEKDLLFYCDIVLNRNNDQMRTLWKRPDHYLAFCRTSAKIIRFPGRDKVLKFNEYIQNLFERFIDVRGYTKELGKFAFSQELEKSATELLDDNHRVFISFNASFRAGPSSEFKLFHKDTNKKDTNKGISVDSISPTVAALGSAWMKSPQLMAFYKGFEEKIPGDVERRKVEFCAKIALALKEMEQKYVVGLNQ